MKTLRIFLSVWLCLTANQAYARCEGAVMLGGLHDAYAATLFTEGAIRQRAAVSLMVFVGGQNGEQLSRQVARDGVEADAKRLVELLRDAEGLARATLNNMRIDTDIFHHGRHIDWLASLYLSSGCSNSAAATSQSVASGGFLAKANAAKTVPKPSYSHKTGITAAIIFMIVLAMIAMVAMKFSGSIFLRRRIAERLPRHPVSFAVEVTFTDPEGEMKQAECDVVDISRGGLKLNWPEPPPAKTIVTLTLLASQRLSHVVWSNSHYAGLIFDTQLTKAEFNSLSDTHQSA